MTMSQRPEAGRGSHQLVPRQMTANRRPLLISLPRYCADEDDAVDELVEEHITKVKAPLPIVFIERVFRRA